MFKSIVETIINIKKTQSTIPSCALPNGFGGNLRYKCIEGIFILNLSSIKLQTRRSTNFIVHFIEKTKHFIFKTIFCNIFKLRYRFRFKTLLFLFKNAFKHYYQGSFNSIFTYYWLKHFLQQRT